MTGTTSTTEHLGPIDYLIVEFSGSTVPTEGFRAVLDLADRGVIQVLDLEFVGKNADGSTSVIEVGDLAVSPGFDMAIFDGASSGLLDDEDISRIGDAIAAGNVAAVLVYEELSILRAIDAWEKEGAQLIGEGPILADDLIATIDATSTEGK